METEKQKEVIIAICEDDHDTDAIDIILYTAGMQLAKKATNQRQVNQLLDKVHAGEIKPTLAIIDTFVEFNHTDGDKIASQLKEMVPGIKIMAHTVLREDQPWAEYTTYKGTEDKEKNLLAGLQHFIPKDFSLDNSQ